MHNSSQNRNLVWGPGSLPCSEDSSAFMTPPIGSWRLLQKSTSTYTAFLKLCGFFQPGNRTTGPPIDPMAVTFERIHFTPRGLSNAVRVGSAGEAPRTGLKDYIYIARRSSLLHSGLDAKGATLLLRVEDISKFSSQCFQGTWHRSW